MAVVTFQNELSRDGSRVTRKLLSRLMKYPPTTWDEIHNAYYAKVRADDDDLNRPTRWLVSVWPLLSAHNFCLSPTKIVYDLEKLRTEVKWPSKMRSVPSTRKSDALCEFHQERGHKTKDYIALKQEVVNILQQGHLKVLLSDKGRNNFARGHERQGLSKPPSPTRTTNMIIGGNDDVSINGVKFTITHKLKKSITHERYDRLEESIIFDKSDAGSLTFHHNDALVITLCTLDTDVKSILVDDGSVACIIHP
ncbi:PREDICTED: uncharacterized protein LOC109232572 [Nicotiana attenuata]|uniref:uncharacterized protein LOC109232572 n=1 Tax=Nicotiana attenuata TaxID=49451 RepID=UPI0009056246|nr:PREDICTED: uncharacterized protein LOC109232572 [Nicotiana attenuata]